MKYLGLVWSSLWRKKVRTILTMLSVMVAFLLFVALNAVGYAFNSGADFANAQRLVTLDKISLIRSLPISYKNKISAIPGVDLVTHVTWFGGTYQEPKNQVFPFPVVPEEYLSIYPELVVDETEKANWIANRTGAVIGQGLADKYGWKVGDRVPIISDIWTSQSGSRTWEFDIEGIVTTTDERSTEFMLFQYDYFDEARAFGQGSVGWYVIRVTEDADPAAVADEVDAQFANAPSQTETSTEAAFAESFAKQFGDIGLIVFLILSAVFFTLLLVSGNTMSQAVRERIGELAVMKTLGFKDGTVLAIVLTESLLIVMIGGLLGLGLGYLLTEGLAAALQSMLPNMGFTGEMALQALGLMVLAGILSGVFPAIKAMRLSIVDGLMRS